MTESKWRFGAVPLMFAQEAFVNFTIDESRFRERLEELGLDQSEIEIEVDLGNKERMT